MIYLKYINWRVDDDLLDLCQKSEAWRGFERFFCLFGVGGLVVVDRKLKHAEHVRVGDEVLQRVLIKGVKKCLLSFI